MECVVLGMTVSVTLGAVERGIVGEFILHSSLGVAFVGFTVVGIGKSFVVGHVGAFFLWVLKCEPRLVPSSGGEQASEVRKHERQWRLQVILIDVDDVGDEEEEGGEDEWEGEHENYFEEISHDYLSLGSGAAPLSL